MTDRNNIRTWERRFFLAPRPQAREYPPAGHRSCAVAAVPRQRTFPMLLFRGVSTALRAATRHAPGGFPGGRLACLLHDASEAFISDITRPVKHNLPEYLVIEKRLQDTIYRRFGIDPEDAEVMRNVSAIDDAMLYHEFLALSGYPLYDSVPEIASQPVFGSDHLRKPKKATLKYYIN